MTAAAPKPIRLEFAALPASATVVVVPAARLAIAAEWLTWEQALACLARMLNDPEGAWCVTTPLSVIEARGWAESVERLALVQ